MIPLNKFKAWSLRISFAVLVAINTLSIRVAEAVDFGFSVDGSGKVQISGGNFPDLSKNGEAGIGGAMAGILDRYKTVGTAIFGFCTVTAFILMVIQFTKLAAAGDNEQARKKAIMGILTCGVAIMLLGGITIVINFFYTGLNAPAAGG